MNARENIAAAARANLPAAGFPDFLQLPAEHEILAISGWGETPNRRVHCLVLFKDIKVTRFATYECDLVGNCFWGHYFDTIEEATHDYARRRAKGAA